MNNFKRNIYRTETIQQPQSCITIAAVIVNDELVRADDGTLRAYYTDCNGAPAIFEFIDPGSFNNAFCAKNGTQLALQYVEGGVYKVARQSTISYTQINC
jgi:hypothetical protein